IRDYKVTGVQTCALPIYWLADPIWAMPALIILGLWKGFGYNMVLFLAGLQGIPVTLYEAAMIDGANGSQRFWKITLPLLSPAMRSEERRVGEEWRGQGGR